MVIIPAFHGFIEIHMDLLLQKAGFLCGEEDVGTTEFI
jgi:hypothetical protein